MLIQAHPGLRLELRRVGAEGAPLLVIDQLVADPDRLVRKAARAQFMPQGAMFPGIRVRAPLSYESLWNSCCGRCSSRCSACPRPRGWRSRCATTRW